MRALTGLGWISGLIDSDGFIVERLSEFLAVLLGRLFDLDNLSLGGEGEGSCLHAQLLVDEGPECGRGLGELLVKFLGVVAELFDIALP